MKSVFKLSMLSGATLCALGAAWAQTSIPVKTIEIKGHPIRAQIGKARDAQGQKVTDALVYALGRRVRGMNAPLTLKVVPGANAAKGQFSEIYLSGKPATVKKLRITELTLRARDVRVDVPYLFSEKKVQTLASKTSLRAVVSESDLTYLLAQGKHSRSMGMTVKFLSGNRFRVAGNWNYGLLSGPIVGVAKLEMGAANTINVRVQSLQLNGAQVPAFVKTKFEERLNPIIDYNDFPFQPRIKSLKVVGNKATITA